MIIYCIPCFHINKIAFLLKPLNFADLHYFNHALISGIMVIIFGPRINKDNTLVHIATHVRVCINCTLYVLPVGSGYHTTSNRTTSNQTDVSNSSDSSANYFSTSSTGHIKITEFSCSN